jgi:hypothetical protein
LIESTESSCPFCGASQRRASAPSRLGIGLLLGLGLASAISCDDKDDSESETETSTSDASTTTEMSTTTMSSTTTTTTDATTSTTSSTSWEGSRIRRNRPWSKAPLAPRDLLDALAQAHALHLERAVVAIGVVAGAAEQRLAHGGAAGHAGLGVVALAAVAPEVVDGAVCGCSGSRGALPQRAQAVLAPVAADVGRAAEAGAALDRAVALDADGRCAGGAALVVAVALLRRGGVLERAEVAEVVAGPEADAELAAAVEDAVERSRRARASCTAGGAARGGRRRCRGAR